jgi:hypothetical protein
MTRHLRAAGFSARMIMLAREAFEANVAIRYDAPWTRQSAEHKPVGTNKAA